ncbi:hypothetical protein B0H15DRAFT_385557 [Mycena belliarum]|uniref:RING-type domain-containing protein n=1 Tax=Mycena belliarum TaxID=1033014 RepID=A0AAD6XSN3_9AGAR|nr:hypothetical protein B0H15DRAFT_385557 [Mycena belliae]
MPRRPRPGMALSLPDHVEYTLDLGAESGAESGPATPTDAAPAAPRTRSWRPADRADPKARSGAYDAAGRLKLTQRARVEAQRECAICAEAAAVPTRVLCCGALFCREHIEQWIYSPASTGLCPACDAPCVLPPSDDADPDAARRPRTPPSSRAHTPPPSPTVLAGTAMRRSADGLVRVVTALAVLLVLVLIVRRGGVGFSEPVGEAFVASAL